MNTIASGTPTLKNLMMELNPKVAQEWEEIGIMLNINEGVLRQIKRDNAPDTRSCLREMLRIWLKQVHPPPSWSIIAQAIDDIGGDDIASRLRLKYCSGMVYLHV